MEPNGRQSYAASFTDFVPMPAAKIVTPRTFSVMTHEVLSSSWTTLETIPRSSYLMLFCSQHEKLGTACTDDKSRLQRITLILIINHDRARNIERTMRERFV